MPKSVSGITRMAHEHPKFRHFAPLKIYSPDVWVWRWREKWCKKIARALVAWQRFLGYVEVFSRPKHSRTHFCHHFRVFWTSRKSVFEQCHFPDCWPLMSQNRLIGSQWAGWVGSYDAEHRPCDVCNYYGQYYAICWLCMHHFELLTRHTAPGGLILVTYRLRFAFLKMLSKVTKTSFLHKLFF